MKFPSALLRLEAKAQLFWHYAVLVKVLIKRRRVRLLPCSCQCIDAPDWSSYVQEIRKERDGGSSISFFKETEAENFAALLSFLLFSFSCSSFPTSPITPPPLLLPPLPLPRCVCCCVCNMSSPWQVDCVIALFCPSPCAPSALRPPFRCTVRGSAAKNPWPLCTRSWVLCITPEHGFPRAIFSCNRPRKNHNQPRRLLTRAKCGDDRS